MYSTRKVHENYWCSSSIACQEKEQIEYLEYSMIYPQNSGASAEGQSGQGVTQLVIKPFSISRTVSWR